MNLPVHEFSFSVREPALDYLLISTINLQDAGKTMGRLHHFWVRKDLKFWSYSKTYGCPCVECYHGEWELRTIYRSSDEFINFICTGFWLDYPVGRSQLGELVKPLTTLIPTLTRDKIKMLQILHHGPF